MTTVNASTSLVLVDTTNTSSIVYLSTLQNPGALITIRDSAGFASANSSIHVSTTQNINFFDSTYDGIGYRITQPYGFLTFTPRTSNVWALVNSFAFPDQTNAFVETVTTSTIVTNFLFQSNGFLSSQQGLFSTIGVNCNAPNPLYRVDIAGGINASSFFINGQPFVADGNISTLRSSTILVNGRLNFVGGLSTFPMSNWGGGVDLMDLLYVASTNRVGIRTSTPNFTLDVNGTMFGTSSIASTAIVNASLTASSLRSLESQISTVTTSTIQSLATTTPLTMNTFVTMNNARSSNIWVTGGQGATAAQSLLFSTDNGSNWTAATSGGFTTSNGCLGVAYNGTQWVAVGEGFTQAGYIQTSTDGSNWNNTTNQVFNAVNTFATCVAWNGRYWIAGAVSPTVGLSNLHFSSNGTNWTNVTSASFSSGVRGVAWNGRYWVAVGQGATPPASIEYSFNGLTWSNSVAGGFTGNGNGVAWNGSMWVAVGSDSTASATIKYSYDGSNWSNSASGSFITTGGFGVAWNGRMWVAVGAGGTTAASIKYSYDGINWFNSLSGGFTTVGRGIAWNGNRWVATGHHLTSAASNVQVSSDGMNWSAPTSGTAVYTSSFSVAFSSNVNADLQFDNLSLYGKTQYPFTISTNTVYMATSSLQINAMTLQNPGMGVSNIGINNPNPSYTLDVNGSIRATSSLISSIETVILDVTTQARVSSLYVTSSVGINTSTPFYTLDVNGIANTSSLITTLLRTPATPSNVWVAGAPGGAANSLFYSLNNGSNWSAASNTATGNTTFTSLNEINAIAYNGQYFLAAGTTAGLLNLLLYRSTDGISWTPLTPIGTFPSRYVNRLLWTGTQWIANGRHASNSNALICRSPDGINWLGTSSGTFPNPGTTTTYGVGLAFNGRRLVAMNTGGSAASILKYSDDQGVNWTNCGGSAFDVGTYTGNVTTNGRIFVATGGAGAGNIKYSFDGITFSNAITASSYSQGTDVAWNGTLFVATGLGGTTIMYSYDGLNWSNATTPFTSEGITVRWSGTQFVALGTDSPATNVVKLSRDGITWTNSSSGIGGLGTGYTVAYSSNLVPDLRIDNLATYGKAQYNYVTSTNTMNLGTSSITFNSLLTVQNPVLGGSNVGIGTENPRNVLDIRAPSGFGTMSLQNNSITGNVSFDFWNSQNSYIGSIGYGNSNSASGSIFQDRFWLYHNTKDLVFLGSGTAERMRVTSSGSNSVGIGITPTQGRLEVAGSNASGETIALYLRNNVAENAANLTTLGFGTNSGSLTGQAQIVAGQTTVGNGYGYMVFRTFGASGMTERMRITDSGLVGIGTFSPAATLDIVGNVKQSRRDYQRAGMYNASSSNYIICYSNVITNNLSGYITYNANSSVGDSWTVNKSGVYSVQYNFWVATGTTTFHMIDRNDASSNFSSPTSATLLAFGSRNNFYETNISWTGYLAVNDVVRGKSQLLGSSSVGQASVWITLLYEC